MVFAWKALKAAGRPMGASEVAAAAGVGVADADRALRWLDTAGWAGKVDSTFYPGVKENTYQL